MTVARLASGKVTGSEKLKVLSNLRKRMLSAISTQSNEIVRSAIVNCLCSQFVRVSLHHHEDKPVLKRLFAMIWNSAAEVAYRARLSAAEAGLRLETVPTDPDPSHHAQIVHGVPVSRI